MSARFSIIPARAVCDTRLSRGALLVLNALGIYGDLNGWCWPSQGTIAKCIKLHRTSVTKYITELEQLGYIEKKRQAQEGKGEINSLYRILFDGELPVEFDAILQQADGNTFTPPVNPGFTPPVNPGFTPPVNPEFTPPVNPEFTPPVNPGFTRTSHITPQRTTQGNAPNISAQAPDAQTAPPLWASIAESAIPSTAPPPKASVPAEFEAFWREYPPRAGGNPKNSALKSWNARRKEGHSADEILAGTRRYAAFCTATDKTGGEYVKQACTFLGPDKFFTEAWDLPTQPATPHNGQPRPFLSKQDRIAAQSEAALAEWMANQAPINVIEGECHEIH